MCKAERQKRLNHKWTQMSTDFTGNAGAPSNVRPAQLSQCAAHGREEVRPRGWGDGLFGFLVRMLDEVRREFLEKGRGMAGDRLPVFFSGGAMADGERLHGAGDGDIEEAALFIERAFGFGAGVREQAIFHAD